MKPRDLKLLDVTGFVMMSTKLRGMEDVDIISTTNMTSNGEEVPGYRLVYPCGTVVNLNVNGLLQLGCLGFAPDPPTNTWQPFLDALHIQQLVAGGGSESDLLIPSAVVDAFLPRHLLQTPYTELAEAVLAIVAAVPRSWLWPRDSEQREKLRPYERAAFELMQRWYREVHLPSCRPHLPITSARREGAPSGGQDGEAREAESSNVDEGPSRPA